MESKTVLHLSTVLSGEDIENWQKVSAYYSHKKTSWILKEIIRDEFFRISQEENLSTPVQVASTN